MKLNPISIVDRATPLEKVFLAALLLFIVGIAVFVLEMVIVGGFVLFIYVICLYIFVKKNV
jgi:hypothetical protein